MKALTIEATKATPEINFGTDGQWLLQGKCCPENPINFFEPVFRWIKLFKHSDSNEIQFSIKLTYFNTSSSKALLDFFDLLYEVKLSGKSITVQWYYEEDDEDMLESGEEFSEDVDLNFNFLIWDDA